MLNRRAALAEVMATNSLGVRRPLFTTASQMTAMRSSTPPVPLGIWAKFFWPMAFCAAQNTQWSVAVVCNWPDCRPRQSASWWALGRNGGVITCAAARAKSGSRYTLSSISRGPASPSPYTPRPPLAARAGAGYRVGGFLATDMHHIDRHSEHLGNGDGALGGLGLDQRRAGQR